MAKRGPKETPTELKILRGTRSDRVNEAAPLAVAGRPTPPAYLKGEAREFWDEAVGYLEQLGVLSLTDGLALEIFSVVYARWRKATQELEAVVSATTAAGTEKSHPSAAVAAAAEDRLLKFMSEFGLTPSSRGRLNTGKKEAKVDRFSKFMDKRKNRSG